VHVIWAGKDQEGKQWDENCSAGTGYAYQVSVMVLVFADPSGKFRAGAHLHAAEDFDSIGDLRFEISDLRM
jgi:hypothetical protein